jgi:cold shock CspA family protein
MAATVSGVILFYLESKRYGFIEHNDTKYFFHRNNIDDIKAKGDPLSGQFVRFEEAGGAKGPKAIHITRVPETSSEVRYELAKGFNIYHKLVGEQKNLLLAVADWTITMRDKGSCSDIKRRLYEEAQRFGANGILAEPEHETEECSSGNYVYTVHSLTVRPCLIGKKSSKGLRADELAGLNARLEVQFNKSEPEPSGISGKTKLTIAAGLAIFLIGLPTVILAFVGAIILMIGFSAANKEYNRSKGCALLRYSPVSHSEAVYKPKLKSALPSELRFYAVK